MKISLKAMATMVALTVMLGVNLGSPHKALAIFINPADITPIFIDPTLFQISLATQTIYQSQTAINVAANQTLTMADTTTTLLAPSITSLGTILAAGLFDLGGTGTLTSSGTMTVTGQTSVLGSIQALAGINCYGYTRPAPPPPPKDEWFQALIDTLTANGFAVSDGLLAATGTIKVGGTLSLPLGAYAPGGQRIAVMASGAPNGIDVTSANLDVPVGYNFVDPTLKSADGKYTFEVGYLEAAPVPEPSTLLLLGGGLAGIVGWGSRRRMKNKPV